MSPPDAQALSLVQEGWHRLGLGRPLAAWACWRRALQVRPDDPAARQALDRLESAPDLPRAARQAYTFRTAADERRRARWDAALRGHNLEDLADAADAFA